MAIIFYCHRCGQRGEFETKKDMKCECGHYVKKRNNTKDHVNMRTTWSGQTQVEFTPQTMQESVEDMGGEW